jgi:superfamily II DNA/RNA helicase
MSKRNKNQQDILDKFGITTLNPMQEEAGSLIHTNSDVIILSPTGTGKTLAFLLPLIDKLDPKCGEIQLLILVPSRELAIQIEQVVRKMGAGFKVNAVYGGRSGTLDKIDLQHRPAVLIGTPGRIADRLRRDNFSLEHINTLVLDEFDKSLEIGFEKEMTEIVEALPSVKQRILTSATSDVKIPDFVRLDRPKLLDYNKSKNSQLKIQTIVSPEKDKLDTLTKALRFIGPQPGIIFCSFKDALERVSQHLAENKIEHGCFHGGMEQIDRERSLIKFRNGSHQLLVATDLAARGLDIPEIKFILHYHLPLHKKEFTHRNGRTARMNSEGVAYILQWKNEEEPDYIQQIAPPKTEVANLEASKAGPAEKWQTLYITGGRRDKISKGDIAGLLFKVGKLGKEQVGVIELSQNCSYVGVRADIAGQVVPKINNQKLKKKKVRISLI